MPIGTFDIELSLRTSMRWHSRHSGSFKWETCMGPPLQESHRMWLHPSMHLCNMMQAWANHLHYHQQR